MREERAAAKKKLLEAKRLIEAGWCRGAYARDAEWHSCSPYGERATRYCMAGALFAVGIIENGVEVCTAAIVALEKAVGEGVTLADANDAAESAREVAAYFDKAISFLDESMELRA